MVKVMREVDYRLFRDGPRFGWLGRAVSLVSRLGLYRGDYLHQWITDQLGGCGVRTFGDLRIDDAARNLPAERAYKLVVVVSDVTSGHMVRLPWDYGRYGLDPDKQLVADALRASTFLLPSVLAQAAENGPVAICIDGGMLSNFPINIFDRVDGRPRWPTFGVKLSAEPPVGSWDPSWAPVLGPISLMKALVATMMNAHDRLYLDDPAVRARTVFVETDGVRATDFDIAADVCDELYRRGRAAAKEFLVGWDFDEHLRKYRPVTA